MKDLFREYLPFLKFLGKFLGSYIVLALLYNIYLQSFDTEKFEPDSFTVLVAKQSAQILGWCDFDFKYELSHNDPSVTYCVNNTPFVRIIEGCNALSIMVLFTSFVLAFFSGWFKTIRFLVIGIIVIHILNVARIALLTLGLFYYPQYKELLHDIVFPLFIYGVVFILWVLWVNKFSDYAKANKK